MKWHNDQFVGFHMVFVLLISKYYGMHSKINKKHHVSKILNCTCNFPPIDDCKIQVM